MPAQPPKKSDGALPARERVSRVSSPPERLQKWLAQAGIGSRRTCETFITEGRVKVNGAVVTELGTKIQPGVDRVTFNGRPVLPPTKRYYIALNKPRGYVCSLSDMHAARLVTELVELPTKPMLRPVGRLDADSEGLIFLTDDGDFLYRMTHPKYHVPKTYRAEVTGVPGTEAIERLTRGLMLDDGPAAPAENVSIRRSKAPVLRPAPGEVASEGRAEIELTIFEGRNRQVRRMLAAVGHPVSKLTRVRIGAVRLTGLATGAWRHLTPGEVEQLSLEQSPQQKSSQEKPKWQTAPQPSKPPRVQSSPNLPRQTPPARPRTSSNSPRRGSTTD